MRTMTTSPLCASDWAKIKAAIERITSMGKDVQIRKRRGGELAVYEISLKSAEN